MLGPEDLKVNALSAREIMKIHGINLTAEDFVPSLKSKESPQYLMPMPSVPHHLVSESDFEKLKSLLDTCTKLINPWVDRPKEQENEEFVSASGEFKKITGVDVLEIIKLARRRFQDNLGPGVKLAP